MARLDGGLVEGGEDVVADAGGAEGVDAHVRLRVHVVAQVQGTNRRHRRPHAVPDHVPRLPRVLRPAAGAPIRGLYDEWLRPRFVPCLGWKLPRSSRGQGR